MGFEAPDSVISPGFEVTVYEVIGLPPSEAGGVKLTVAWVFPAVAAASVGASGMVALLERNAAVIAIFLFTVTMQSPVPEHPSPDHPLNLESPSSITVKLTVVPDGKDVEQVWPQHFMPAGVLVTCPLPDPDLFRVKVPKVPGPPRTHRT
jgi:hypothetical protein